jgi:hypothetical protein
MKWSILLAFLLILSIIPIISASDINVGDGTHTLSTGSELVLTGTTDGVSRHAWVWIFGYGGKYSVYSKPIDVYGGEFTARIPEMSSFPEGDYTVLVQFSGRNDIQEVTCSTDIFGSPVFYSPWKNVTSTPISLNPDVARGQLYNLTNNTSYSDDAVLDYIVHIEPAFIKFTDLYVIQGDEKNIKKNGRMYVGGTTNLDTYDHIRVIVDYMYENTTYASVDYRGVGYRVWHAEINVSNMQTAGTHYVVVESDKISPMTQQLDISQYIPTPKPTPTQILYVSNEFRSIPTTSPTPEQTSAPIFQQTQVQFVAIKTPEPVDTPQAAIPGAVTINAAVKSTAVNKPINLSATQSPISSLIPICGLLIVGIFILLKRQK